MNEIRCAGKNENRLHPQEFQRLFVIECQALGNIVQLTVYPQFAFAIVKPRG